MRRALPLLALLALAAPAAGRDAKPEELLRQAEAALQAKDSPKAEALLRDAIRADPQNARAFLLLGQVLERRGRLDEALAAVNEVLRLDPKMIEALDLRGSVNFKRGDVKAAVADFDRYL